MQNIQKYLKENLSLERYNHSLGVSQIAGELAIAHGFDLEKAKFAGLIHDVCREWTDEQILKYDKENQVGLSETMRKRTVLAHGKIATVFLPEEFGINDKEILDALETHTLGGKEMSVMQKILFVADFLEGTSDKNFSKEIYELALTDLAKATLEVFEKEKEHCERKGLPLAPEFLKNYEANKRALTKVL